ncbi:hypothetical protein RHGRI_016388 [Rhododendron griersonianum]|uniref:Uncharacterized protein n=1 Tax=Rhododendron griersonianum TaxID=479676 RepID=A0AAV6JTY6_9ERIC|nr:hypothetical protein RHGRI_016388 [Rhododendron griersonianum]
MGIVESKIRQENMAGAMKKCLPDGWDFVHNIGTGSVARIIVVWDTQGPKISVLVSSDQMMLLSVQVDTRIFALSVVYGFNQVGPRRQLWDELSDIQNRMKVAREELSNIQTCCAQLPGDPIRMEYERLCHLNFNDLCVAEEAWCR